MVIEEIPLTLEILLNPSEDDHVPQGNPHSRVLNSLTQRLRRYLERRGDWGVFSDLMVHWARKDLRSVAPDVTVAQGIADPEAVDENLDVAAAGCRVRAVFEVVTTRSKIKREKDEIHNKPLFAAAGVEDYVLLYPVKYRKRGDRAVRHFTLQAGGAYREQKADAEGRYVLGSLGLWLSIDESEELVLADVATGERILTPKEEEERRLQAERLAAEEAAARQAAERRATEEAAARQTAEQARQAAEHRAAEEEAARQAAEAARQAANRRSTQLLVAVLERRGLTLDAAARRRILDCNDPRELERWAEQAFTVAMVEDLWEDLP